MKVLIYALSRAQGGIENFLHNYCKRMEGIEFDFICIDEKAAYQEELEKLGYRVLFVPMKSEGKEQHNRGLEKIFQETKYDIAWFNENNLCDILFLKLAKKYKVPVRICHSHNAGMNAEGIKKELKIFVHSFYKSRIAAYATDFWACSEKASEWFYKKKGQERAEIIPNAICTKEFAYNEKIREEERRCLGIENKFVIGHVGRFSEQKNHKFLLEILRETLRLYKDTILLLLGDGPLLADIQLQAEEMKVKDQILFLGQRKDIPKLLQAIDVFAFPSLYEGMPVSLIEAQAAGLPCVVSKNITQEIKITSEVEFCDINDQPEIWADKLLKVKDHIKDRRKVNETLKKSKYDIEYSAKLLEEKLQLFVQRK